MILVVDVPSETLLAAPSSLRAICGSDRCKPPHQIDDQAGERRCGHCSACQRSQERQWDVSARVLQSAGLCDALYRVLLFLVGLPRLAGLCRCAHLLTDGHAILLKTFSYQVHFDVGMYPPDWNLTVAVLLSHAESYRINARSL